MFHKTLIINVCSNCLMIIIMHLFNKETIYIDSISHYRFLFRLSALPFELKSSLVLAVVVILFHVLDRQIEFTSRTDFLWKAKLKVEQEEVETMRGINKVSG